MRILMLGDQANVAIQLSSALAARGHEVWHVLVDTTDVRARVPAEPARGVEVMWSRPTLPSLFERASRLCGETDFDVIHSHRNFLRDCRQRLVPAFGWKACRPLPRRRHQARRLNLRGLGVKKVGHIMSVAVHPDYRRRGSGGGSSPGRWRP